MTIRTELVTLERIREELPGLLASLPAWRREKALSYHFDKDRYLCAKSFWLLKTLAAEEFGIVDFPVFFYGANGKPYWKEYPQVHFNISHCDTGVACAIAKEPVGIDIERIFFDDDLAREVLSPEELEAVQQDASPAQRFITYWTQKESLLKLMGCGIDDDLKNVLLRHREKVSFETYVCLEHGYIVTLATWKDGVEPVQF